MFGAAQPLASPCQGEVAFAKQMTEGWLRCRERYRYDRRVKTGTLQQKMGRIASYTQRYSVPLRLHPPVTASPCQPPLARGAERFEQPRKQSKSFPQISKEPLPHKIQFSTTKHKNSCRRQQQATTWRVPSNDRRVFHESPGVQGPKPLVLFPRLFQKSRALAGQATSGRVATLYLVRIGRHTGGKDSTHPPAQQGSLNT